MPNKAEFNAKMNTARVRLTTRPLELEAEVRLTSRGLLAIGFLVSAILLSVAPIIHEATQKLPPR